MQTLKIVLTVPTTHTETVLMAIGEAGGGQFDQTYDYCAFIVRGEGRFRPLAGAHPAIGDIGQIAQVAEDRIEVTVTAEKMTAVIAAVRQVHPYEVPVIDVYPLLDLTQ
jgi:hypothetical protein